VKRIMTVTSLAVVCALTMVVGYTAAAGPESGMDGVPAKAAPPGQEAFPGGADPNDLPATPSATEPLGDPPRVSEYANSGCKRDDVGPCEEGDMVEFTVDGSTLQVLHTNATYNCCPDDIVISLSIEGDVISLKEEEILTLPCYCVCCYDVEATVVDLAPGEYTVEFCWYDYETYEEHWYSEDIVIGSGERFLRDGSGGSSDDSAVSPDLGGPRTPVPVEPAAEDRESTPHVDEYSNTGCRVDDLGPCDEDDVIELTVDGTTLHVLHANTTYNCCLDDIVISLTMEGDVITLTEEEIATMPCWCICCYDVEATIVDLAPGEYTVEFCWYDYELYEDRCHYEEIVVP
jgi:hypothetical protein